jgi:hypothetical protein
MPDLYAAPERREPALASLAPDSEDPRPFDAHPSATRGSPFPWGVIGIVVVAAAVVAIAYWQLRRQAPAPAPIAEEAPAVTTSPAQLPPAIRYPLETPGAAGVAGTPPQPDPADGEAAIRDGLFGLPGAAGLERLLVSDNMVRRIVATIDNLPRRFVAAQVRVSRPVDGAFVVDVDVDEGAPSVGRANAARYAPYVRIAEAIDVAPLVAFYVRHYASFQQAYRDLGYPNGYFNDRVVDVIDDLLATPEVTAPPRLVQPRVLHEFANPDLEARSAGQKILLRMDPAQARTIKAKLREIRAALTRGAPARAPAGPR